MRNRERPSASRQPESRTPQPEADDGGRFTVAEDGTRVWDEAAELAEILRLQKEEARRRGGGRRAGDRVA